MFEVLAESNAKLMAKAIDLEVRNHRNNLRIIGLPESIEGPGPTDFFSKLLVELLGEQTLVSPLELGWAHRVPVARLQNGARLRPMIIRLHCFQIKDQIIREARKRRGSISWVCCTDFWRLYPGGTGAVGEVRRCNVKAVWSNHPCCTQLAYKSYSKVGLENGLPRQKKPKALRLTTSKTEKLTWLPTRLADTLLPCSSSGEANLNENWTFRR